MSYKEVVQADMRLVILRLLSEMPAMRANSSVLYSALDEFGHSASRDTVKTELAWLAEQGLITREEMASIVVATLTERGVDVAKGRASVPGVKRPGA